MQVREQSPKATPELFNMPRNTGVFRDVYDDLGDVIGQEEIIEHDVPVRKENKADHVAYRRKCKDGEQELRLYEQTTQLLVNDVLLAEQWVVFEYWDGTNWVTPAYVKTIDAKDSGVVVGNVDMFQGGARLTVSTDWVPKHVKKKLIDTVEVDTNPDKQVFIADYKGHLVRVKWIVKIYDPAVNFRYDDYEGNVSYMLDESPVDHDLITVIFEPDGVQDYLEI